jgi:hypothetical protein
MVTFLPIEEAVKVISFQFVLQNYGINPQQQTALSNFYTL